jgi:hypothetical protein
MIVSFLGAINEHLPHIWRIGLYVLGLSRLGSFAHHARLTTRHLCSGTFARFGHLSRLLIGFPQFVPDFRHAPYDTLSGSPSGQTSTGSSSVIAIGSDPSGSLSGRTLPIRHTRNRVNKMGGLSLPIYRCGIDCSA